MKLFFGSFLVFPVLTFSPALLVLFVCCAFAQPPPEACIYGSGPSVCASCTSSASPEVDIVAAVAINSTGQPLTSATCTPGQELNLTFRFTLKAPGGRPGYNAGFYIGTNVSTSSVTAALSHVFFLFRYRERNQTWAYLWPSVPSAISRIQIVGRTTSVVTSLKVGARTMPTSL